MFQESFVAKRGFNKVSAFFRECFTEISRKYKGCFQNSTIFQDFFEQDSDVTQTRVMWRRGW